MKFLNKMVIILFAIFFVVIDRLLKVLALNYYEHDKVSLVSDILTFKFAKNYNIAFSLPVISSFILNILIAIIIIILLYYFLFYIKSSKYQSAQYLALIIIGAISNLVDRISYGYVVDYFDLKYFTIFNIADMMIVGGVIVIILSQLSIKKEQNKPI